MPDKWYVFEGEDTRGFTHLFWNRQREYADAIAFRDLVYGVGAPVKWLRWDFFYFHPPGCRHRVPYYLAWRPPPSTLERGRPEPTDWLGPREARVHLAGHGWPYHWSLPRRTGDP